MGASPMPSRLTSTNCPARCPSVCPRGSSRLKSFSKAAQSCFRTQPAVSAQVRQLEQELNAPLFERLGTKIAITPAGHIFADFAEQILALRLAVKGVLPPGNGGELALSSRSATTLNAFVDLADLGVRAGDRLEFYVAVEDSHPEPIQSAATPACPVLSSAPRASGMTLATLARALITTSTSSPTCSKTIP